MMESRQAAIRHPKVCIPTPVVGHPADEHVGEQGCSEEVSEESGETGCGTRCVLWREVEGPGHRSASPVR